MAVTREEICQNRKRIFKTRSDDVRDNVGTPSIKLIKPRSSPVEHCRPTPAKIGRNASSQTIFNSPARSTDWAWWYVVSGHTQLNHYRFVVTKYICTVCFNKHWPIVRRKVWLDPRGYLLSYNTFTSAWPSAFIYSSNIFLSFLYLPITTLPIDHGGLPQWVEINARSSR